MLHMPTAPIQKFKFILPILIAASVIFIFVLNKQQANQETAGPSSIPTSTPSSKDTLDNIPSETSLVSQRNLLSRLVATPSPSPSSSSSSSDSVVTNPCASVQYSEYDNLVLGDSPVAYYPFTHTSVICDHSGNNFTGKTGGTLTATSLPNGERALKFDGSTSYIEIADQHHLSIATKGKITLEAWIRPDTLQFTNQESTGYVHWLGKGETNKHEYLLRMYSLTNSESRPNRISGYAFNPTGGLGVGSYFQDSLTASEWMHVVFVINTRDTSSTYPTGYTKIYRNGSQRDQDSLSALNIHPENSTAPLRIGTRDFNSFFEGAIGKVAIYDYELSAFQVLEHYQQIVPPVAGSAAFVKNVGKTSTKTTGTSMQITLTESVAAGNTLIARVVTDYSASASSITDSKGNTYTRDRTAPNSGTTIRAAIFSSPITTALVPGDTITITTPNVAAKAAVVDEFSGLLTSSFVDQQNGTSGSSTTPGTTISITTTQDNELILGFVAVEGPLEDTYTEDALGQFSSLPREGTDSGDAVTNVTINGGYKSVGTSGTYQYKPTLDPSRNWITFIISYKAQ